MFVEDISEGASMKLDRASQHIMECQTLIGEFLSKQPYRLVRRRNPQTNEISIAVKQEIAQPWVLSLMIGDAIHNIRSALDLTMFNIISQKTNNPGILRAVQFPFSWRKESLGNTIESRRAKLAGRNVVAEIHRLKPYNGGDQTLYDIHELDVTDKHKQILAVGEVASTTLSALIGVPAGPMGDPTIVMLEGASINLGVFDPSAPFEQDCERQPAFTLRFPDTGPFGSITVQEALGTAMIKAAEVIRAIERAARQA